MFKTTYNMMKLKVKITPQTPLLVASGKTFDVTRPDIQFIRIVTRQGETIYIPGSSLKGVLRGGTEALLGEDDRWKTKICCTSEKMCHDLYRSKKDYKNKLPYKYHCPVCRMFGSGDLASRLEIADVFPFDLDDPDEKKKEKIDALQAMVTSRSGIKIDRKTGKTSPGALFQYEILGGGELFGELTFTNYELYQPGLLFMLFDLSNEGFLRYGHSKSRGLGVLNFDIQSIKILQMGKLKGKTLKGVGILSSPGETETGYDFYLAENDKIDKEYPCEENMLYTTFHFIEKEAVREVAGLFKEKIDSFLSAFQA
jgi:CRISPR-associated protein Csm3